MRNDDYISIPYVDFLRRFSDYLRDVPEFTRDELAGYLHRYLQSMGIVPACTVRLGSRPVVDEDTLVAAVDAALLEFQNKSQACARVHELEAFKRLPTDRIRKRYNAALRRRRNGDGMRRDRT